MNFMRKLWYKQKISAAALNGSNKKNYSHKKADSNEERTKAKSIIVVTKIKSNAKPAGMVIDNRHPKEQHRRISTSYNVI